MKNKISILLLIGLVSFTLDGCVILPTDKNPNEDENGCEFHMDDDRDTVCDVCGESLVTVDYTADGIYNVSLYTVSGVDYTSSYYANYIILNNGNVTWVKTDITGSTVDTGTYVKENNEVTITIGIKPYKFAYDSESKKIEFSGTLNKKKVVMEYMVDSNFTIGETTGDVEFTDKLFGEDLNENFYNYCPSVMIEGNNTMHIWYCSNQISGNVTDFIAYRKGTLSHDGKWSFSEKHLVLEPTPNTWDSRHACDPSVVKGVFKYNDETYSYLMAYLGCETSDVTDNEVSIAVAKSPEGPWVKYENKVYCEKHGKEEYRAFCDYRHSSEYALNDDNRGFWGYGQPSLVSVDKAGKVLLFFTKGIKLGTYTYVEYWDLSNLNNPVKLNEKKLTDGGEIGICNNADFAYDPATKRIYIIKEDHIGGWYPSDGGVNWISGSNSLFYTPMGKNDTYPGESLFGSHNWSKVATIGKDETGFARVHNAGIVTDEYGWIIDSNKVPVVYTMSELKTDYPDWELGGQWPALHTYRLHGYVVNN